jgi:predicted RNase H-like nuclease (RuvC/YqgF family)
VEPVRRSPAAVGRCRVSEFDAPTRVNTTPELVARSMMLGPDHREVFELLLDKAEAGKRKYGVLELAADARDFEAEARAELLDCVHYMGAKVVQLKRTNQAAEALIDKQKAEIERLRASLAHAQRAIDAQIRIRR